ncbi:MAG: sulfite exporter TauE/SafE family protein [Gammaproteobacteria bacterium]|jgi:hypothetical protein|nr:sulfite exporter TauE/SafE family protein [Gammaproteobacteria bacterium]
MDSFGALLLAMVGLGLAGAPHCAGMCGGISGLLSLNTAGERRYALLAGYHVGRVASYSLAGAVAGLLGQAVHARTGLPALHLFTGVMLLLAGLYLAGWRPALAWLERLAGILWRRLQPVAGRLLPVRRFRESLLLGAVWGWLPCGLVYGALSLAAGAGDAGRGALGMAVFGAVTVPSVLGVGMITRWLRERPLLPLLRRGLGVAFAIAGLWLIVASGRMLLSGDEHRHAHRQPAAEQQP